MYDDTQRRRRAVPDSRTTATDYREHGGDTGARSGAERLEAQEHQVPLALHGVIRGRYDFELRTPGARIHFRATRGRGNQLSRVGTDELNGARVESDL